MNELTHQELCTVLAALRVFQQVTAGGGSIPAHPPVTQGDYSITHHMTAGAKHITQLEHFDDGTRPLSDEQIDALCERLNCQDPDDPLQAVIRAQEAVEALALVGIHSRLHARIAEAEYALAVLRKEVEAST